MVWDLAYRQTYGQSRDNQNFWNRWVTKFSKVWGSAHVPSARRSSAKNILLLGFNITPNFWLSKVGLNLMTKLFEIWKNVSYHKFIIRKVSPSHFWIIGTHQCLLTGYIVAMVTYYAMKMTTTCLTMIMHLCNINIVMSLDKEWWYWTVKVWLLERTRNCYQPTQIKWI